MNSKLVHLLILFAIARLNQAYGCVNTLPGCVCMYKFKDVYLRELLGYNYSPDNLKLLLGEFDTPNMLGIINCSSNSINLIPNFKQVLNQDLKKHFQINSLDFSKNNLTSINTNTFYDLTSSQTIDLSENNISKISHKGFNGIFNHLVLLKLNNNYLTSITTFPIYFASKITSLKALFLASNKFDTLFDRSFQSIFSGWLKILDLSNNTISCIYEDAFVGLHSLEYLNLCNNKIGTEIIDIEKCVNANNFVRILKHLKAVQNLQLCSNELSNLNSDPLVFKNSTKLKILNLEKNKIKSLNNFFCANETQFSKRNGLQSLNVLNLGWNNIQIIDNFNLNCLQNITDLYLHNNNLGFISKYSFEYLKQLSRLHLENNPNLLNLDWLSSLSSLVYFRFNFNENLQADYDFEKIIENLIVKRKLEKLKSLDLGGSSFETVFINLAHLLLTKNQLETIKCINCSIRYAKLKCDLSFYQHHLTSLTNSENLFIEKFKIYACEKKILNKTLTVDLSDNFLSSCQASGYRVRDEIDMDFYLNKNYTYTCDKIQVNYIKMLVDQIEVKNFDCYHSKKQQTVNWLKYNKRKYVLYSNSQECNYKSSAMNCSDLKGGYLIKKSNVATKNFNRIYSRLIIFTNYLTVYVFIYNLFLFF